MGAFLRLDASLNKYGITTFSSSRIFCIPSFEVRENFLLFLCRKGGTPDDVPAEGLVRAIAKPVFISDA